MSSGKCPTCGKENLKNIEVHMRYCKNRAMKQETVSKSPTPIKTPAEPITSIKPQISLETKENNVFDINISKIKNMLYFNICLNFMTILTLVVIIVLN